MYPNYSVKRYNHMRRITIHTDKIKKQSKKKTLYNIFLLEELENYLTNTYQHFEKEYYFHPKRRWRFDYAIPEYKIAIEIEGAIYKQGRHTRGNGFQQDMYKYNNATLLGWKVFRFSYKDLQKKHYLNFLLPISTSDNSPSVSLS